MSSQNPLSALFSRIRSRFGSRSTAPSFEDFLGSFPPGLVAGAIEVEGLEDLRGILGSIIGGTGNSSLLERLAVEAGIDPKDMDDTDVCPCGQVHFGSGFTAAMDRLQKTGSSKKAENQEESWRKDLAAAQSEGLLMVAPDLAAATVNAFGELLYEQTGGDKEKLVELLGQLKTETIALDEAGATASRTAKRISGSLATAAEDYERRLAEKDEEMARLEDELTRIREAVEEAKSDADSGPREWYTKAEAVAALAGVLAQRYPTIAGCRGGYYFPQNSSGDPADFSERLETAQAQLASSRRGSLGRDEMNKLFDDLKTGRPFCGIYIARDGMTESEIVAGRLKEMLAAAGQRGDLLPLNITLRDIAGSTRPAEEILEANFPKPAEVVEILDEPVVAESVGA